MEFNTWLGQDGFTQMRHTNFIGLIRITDDFGVTRQAMRTQTRHDGFAIATTHLNQRTEFFAEQHAQQFFIATALQNARLLVVIRVLVHRIHAEDVGVDRDAAMRRKGHFGRCSEQTTIRTVVICQQQTIFVERLDRRVEGLELLRVIDIRRIVTGGTIDLCECRTAQTVLTITQINQNQFAIGDITIQRRRQRLRDIRHAREGSHNQR